MGKEAWYSNIVTGVKLMIIGFIAGLFMYGVSYLTGIIAGPLGEVSLDSLSFTIVVIGVLALGTFALSLHIQGWLAEKLWGWD